MGAFGVELRAERERSAQRDQRERLREVRRQIADMPGLRSAATLPRDAEMPEWTVGALTGRLVELSASNAPALLTAAMRLVRDAHHEHEPVAWITRTGSAFYPPDAAEYGVDLAALALIRVPDTLSIGKAAYTLVRSGAFGLIVLDMGRDAMMPVPTQARLVRFGQVRETAVVCLTLKSAEEPSIGSLVSLRGEVRRRRKDSGLFTCEIKILKDKHRAPTWMHREKYRGPVGLS